MSQSQQFQVSLEDTPYYHNCISRCVCRAYLCGEDKYTAQSFEHFRKWMVQLIKQLASVYSINICIFAAMPTLTLRLLK